MAKVQISVAILLGCSVVASCGQGSIASQPIFIVAPNALANAEGNDGGSLPFWSFDQPQSVRYQQVFNSTEFSAVEQPVWIQQIYIRGNSAGASGTGLSAIYPQIQLNLSTTLRSADNLSSAFAENVGSDETVAFSATKYPIVTSYGRFASPQSFGIAFNLQTPYLYDPSRGNLLLDIRNWLTPSFPIPNPVYPGIDGHSQLGDSISCLYGSSVTADQGTLSTFGYVIQFGVTPVPEPSTISILGVVGVALAIGSYRTRQIKRKSGIG